MFPATELSPASLIPIRAERAHLGNDWTNTWYLARKRGLPPDLSSHLFRMLHGILPTQDRVARLGGNRGDTAPGVCRLCNCDIIEDILHAFFVCDNNRVAANALLNAAQLYVPGLLANQSLRLDFKVEKENELPIVFLLAVGFKYIWESRLENKLVSVRGLRAELEARINILALSKFRGASTILLENLRNFQH